MSQQELVKLGVRKRRPDTRMIHTWLGRAAYGNLNDTRVAYAAMLGRPVSTSLIVRRSLELLREHLRTIKAPEAVSAETQAIARNRS